MNTDMFKKFSKNSMAIVIAGLLVAGAVIYVGLAKNPKAGTGNQSFLSPQEAANKAVDYINKVLLKGSAAASLVEVFEEDGMYKMKLTLGEQELNSYVTKDGKLFFPEAFDLNQKIAEEEGKTIGDFTISKDDICQENGKPVVYFFGSKTCPHCTWEKPIVEGVVAKFKDQISFHENIDTQDDMDVFKKYSTGGIPTLILGCKYYRVGSGEQAGEEQETKNLTALFCKITGSNPSGVCDEVQDLISQIK